MTTALTKAARLKPEVRLGQAISEFQADCSSREKATLRSYQAAGIPPSVRDVMQLTAEINRSAGLRGQCFGSRLTSILQAVQEFAALGDIVLGASQSLLACGIWAVVRMSLLVSILQHVCRSVESLSDRVFSPLSNTRPTLNNYRPCSWPWAALHLAIN